MEKKTLEQRVAFLEKRVMELERQLHELGERSQSKQFYIDEKANERKTQPKTSPETNETKTKEHIVSQRKSIEWEVLIFQKILPRVFIFILILGILWGLKAAYDYGLITVHVILGLAIMLSIFMTISGVYHFKKERRVLGQVLNGGAIPIFMLTVFAMHQIYDMIGTMPAFLLNLLAMITGIILTIIFRSQSIGIISLVAGLLVPYLIESTEPNYYFFVSYEGLLYLLFLALSLYLNFKWLYVSSSLFLHFAILGIHIFTIVPESYELLLVSPIIIQQIALFIGFIYTNVSIKVQAYTTLSSILIASIWLFVRLEQIEQVIIFTSFTVLYGIGYYLYRKEKTKSSILVINSSLSILFIFLAYESQFIYEVLLAIIVIYIFYAKKFKTIIHYVLASFFYFIAFFSFNTFYLQSWFSYEMLHILMFLIVTAFLIQYFIKTTSNNRQRRLLKNVAIPYFAILLLFFSSNITYLITNDWSIYDLQPIILSAFWVMIAISFMILSKVTSIASGKFTGVAILFLTVAKIILVDISFMDLSIRAILFIGLGIIGLLISRVYYKK